MNRKVPLLFGVLAAVFAVAFMLQGNATTNTEATASVAVGADVGYQAAIDPTTREFVAPTPTPANEAAKAALEPLSRSDHGLVEEPSPVPGGGVMVNLQGRFQNTFTATTNADGEMVIECDTDNTDNGKGE